MIISKLINQAELIKNGINEISFLLKLNNNNNYVIIFKN